MGYYTDFSLYNDGYLDHEALAETLDEVSGHAWDRSLKMYGVKWYNYDKDMRTLSKMFPDILFTLEGEGEESNDVWKAYYKDGLCQHTEAEITFPPFDESKLK